MTAQARKKTTRATASPYRRPGWLVISTSSAAFPLVGAVVTVVVGVDDRDDGRRPVVDDPGRRLRSRRRSRHRRGGLRLRDGGQSRGSCLELLLELRGVVGELFRSGGDRRI